jgi:hypothetical protein
MQALSLDQLIDKGVAHGESFFYIFLYLYSADSYTGMAIVGGAVALSALLVAGLIRRATRK